MAGTRDIKRKILSVKNTQKVTKAMKMVSSAKMRRATEATLATLPYATKITEVTLSIASCVNDVTLPLLEKPKSVERVALLVMNSDRGLCGAFNANIIRAVSKFQQEHKGKEIQLYIVGKNAYDHYKKGSLEIVDKWISLGGKVSFETAKYISDTITSAFLAKKFDEMYMIYNEFKSVSYQAPREMKIFPLSLNVDAAETDTEYLFEPNPVGLLEELLPRYITFMIYHSLLESAAGEHGARMVAMDNATRSADDMIKKLTLNYNKARQAAITNDLLDIVNGAEALKG
ncbi:MAG: ATP synthase F1 subunit gamma [Deferribacteraceae bacterium]|jgi:F-type H+-transporting ATPase subunit gamma|nr:ATP synthase F1 subunit gamma [Deferribacteraceae bacterium]